MNIKKIVMSGVVLLGISHCHIQGGAIKPTPYIAHCVNIKHSKGGNTFATAVNGNKINREKVCRLGVNTHSKTNKVIIKQVKNPCFFVDKDDWTTDKGIKLNNNTIAFNYGKGTNANPYDYFGSETRPDLGHNLIFHKSGKITHKRDKREVIQVLGTDRNCYLHPTVEEWTFYDKNRFGDFREAGRVKFYLK